MGRKKRINYLSPFAGRTMSRACLAFAFAIATLIALPLTTPAQTNSEKTSQMPGPAPEPPPAPKAVKDSLKAAKAKSKAAKKTKAAAKDSAQTAAPAAKDSAVAPAATAPAAPVAPVAPVAAPAPDSAKTAAGDSGKPAETAQPSVNMAEESKAAPVRLPPDFRLINDPPLIAKEYGFGILGSVVAGTLGFYIGSGIETAIEGESKAHKGTLSFTGIRYDNFQGAFWGGSTGMIFGSALTTYFIGQTDEEDGGFFLTLLGTTAAAAGAYYTASLMGVNDDIDWKPFLPLLAIPSIGGTFGFNVSRWYHDHRREETVGKEAPLRLHAPGFAWAPGPTGDRFEFSALRLTF